MRKAVITVAIIAMVIVFANGAIASTIVFETTGWITGKELKVYPFTADVTPLNYLVTLSDLSTPPQFGFDSLDLVLTTSTDTIDSLSAPGSFTFPATLLENYFINVAGDASSFDAGLFGVVVEANPVPEPSTLLLIVTGLVGLVGFRRKFKA